MHSRRALMTLYLSAFMMGATGIFSKTIHLPAWDITGYRTWVAAFLLFAWVWWRERKIALESVRDYWRIILLGVLLAIHWITFFHSMQVSSMSIGLLSLYAYPVMTVFMEPFVKKTLLDWRDVITAFVVFIGVYFLIPEFDLQNNVTQGVLWGAVSALTFALRNLLLGYWFSGQSAARSMSYQVLIVALLMTPVIFVSEHQPSPLDWWQLLLLGVVFTAFAHTLLGDSLRYLKAKTVALVACIQPVFGVIYDILFLQTIPTHTTLIGGAIILSAAIYESVREHQKQKS
ncbi:MAG: DMT family transporter [Cellvibrio sp.]|nr:DMT family transporter [Cellvibrio sp.]